MQVGGGGRKQYFSSSVRNLLFCSLLPLSPTALIHTFLLSFSLTLFGKLMNLFFFLLPTVFLLVEKERERQTAAVRPTRLLASRCLRLLEEREILQDDHYFKAYFGKVGETPVHHRKSIREKSLLVTLPPPCPRKGCKRRIQWLLHSPPHFFRSSDSWHARGEGRGGKACV